MKELTTHFQIKICVLTRLHFFGMIILLYSSEKHLCGKYEASAKDQVNDICVIFLYKQEDLGIIINYIAQLQDLLRLKTLLGESAIERHGPHVGAQSDVPVSRIMSTMRSV